MGNFSHLYSVFFAPRGSFRMGELGKDIAQQYLLPQDKLIGVMGDAGSGKSMLVKGMFPGLELTNDDEGVNVRPLPILEMLDDPLGCGISKKGMSLFATPHTYHVDIRFEQAFTQIHELAQAIICALQKGKRVVVEHFELVYPYLKMEGSTLPINADILLGVGEEVIVTRPNLFGPIPKDIADIVYKSIRYRKMAHSAEDLTEHFLSHSLQEDCEHADVKHGFVLCFHEKPMISMERLEQKVKDAIAEDLPISFCDDEHIMIGDVKQHCTSPRNHVKSTGQIEGFTLIKDIPYDPITKRYLLVGLIGHNKEVKIGEDLDKLEKMH